jgi:hypothetical protein
LRPQGLQDGETIQLGQIPIEDDRVVGVRECGRQPVQPGLRVVAGVDELGLMSIQR